MKNIPKMKLQDQVCSLEQAKKLKELGIIQNNGTYYHLEKFGIVPSMVYNGAGSYERDDSLGRAIDRESINRYYCLFTVAELGVMLANVQYEAWGYEMMFTSYFQYNEKGWRVQFRNPRNFKNPDQSFQTEAEARADMLIYLLENNHTTPEEVNQGLTQ